VVDEKKSPELLLNLFFPLKLFEWVSHKIISARE
jgi:hypothetical protein